jgi:hypothetical protein
VELGGGAWWRFDLRGVSLSLLLLLCASALSLALARALALALALALGQGRSGAGRSGGQVVRGTRCGDVQADEPALGVQEGGVRAGGV